jgi:hypothetical protein
MEIHKGFKSSRNYGPQKAGIKICFQSAGRKLGAKAGLFLQHEPWAPVALFLSFFYLFFGFLWD